MRQQLFADRTDYIISVFLALSLFFSIIKNALVSCAGVIGIEYANAVNICVYIVLVIMAIFIVQNIMRSINGVDILSILLFLGTILFTWTRVTGYNDLYSDIIINAIVSIAFFCVARSVKNNELAYNTLVIIAPIATVSFWVFFFVGSQNLGEIYSQSMGYNALPIGIISFSALFSTGKKVHIKLLFCVCFASSCFFMIASGARGPMICCLVYIAIKIILIDVVNRRIKVFAMLLIACAFAGIYALNFNSVVFSIKAVIVALGGSTRQIDAVINGTMFLSEGRTDIARYTTELINTHFFSGVGIGRDRVLINEHFFYPREKVVGCYPHNFALELLVQFGVIIGGALVIACVVIIMIGLISKTDKYAKLMVQAFFGIGFLPLMFSGSYINQGQFFVLLALCINVIIDNRRLKRKKAKMIE